MKYNEYYDYIRALRDMKVDYPRESSNIPDVIIRKAQELNLMLEGALAAADYEDDDND